jgi:hypothetical protein
MRIEKFTRPLFKKILMASAICASSFAMLSSSAEEFNLPLQRSIASQPITKLEVISAVKALLEGRVLSVKKKSSYTNPDCYHVKFLENQGELQLIKLSCFTEKLANKNH